MFNELSKIRSQVTYKFWASPGQGQSLDALTEKMLAIGNTILETDIANNRLLLLRRDEKGPPVWGCRLCLASGELVLVDAERELLDHCDAELGGWRAGWRD